MSRFLAVFLLILVLLIDIPTVYSVDDYVSEPYKIMVYKIMEDEVKGLRIIDPLGNEYSIYNSDIYLLDYKHDKIVYVFKNRLWLIADNNIIDLNITVHAPYLAKFDSNANRLLFICSKLTPTIKTDICIYDLDANTIDKITERGDIVNADWLNNTTIIYPIEDVLYILNLKDHSVSIYNTNNLIISEVYVSPSGNKILYASWFGRARYYHILDLNTLNDIIVLSTGSIREPFNIKTISWGLDDEHIIYENTIKNSSKLALAKLNYKFNDSSKVLINDTYYNHPNDIIEKEIVLMQNYTLNEFVIDPEDNSMIAIERDKDGIDMYKFRFSITLPEFNYILMMLSLGIFITLLSRLNYKISIQP